MYTSQILETSVSTTRSISEAVICGNVRAMQYSMKREREKKLPLHLIAKIEHDLKIPEPEVTNAETKSTLHSIRNKKVEVIPTALPSDRTRKE